MEIKDIIKLADAGFSKEDIIKMVSTDPEPAAPATDPEPAAPAADPEPAADPNGEPALNQILDLLHQGFVQTSNQPEQPTVDDILSDIIDPAPPKI